MSGWKEATVEGGKERRREGGRVERKEEKEGMWVGGKLYVKERRNVSLCLM